MSKIFTSLQVLTQWRDLFASTGSSPRGGNSLYFEPFTFDLNGSTFMNSEESNKKKKTHDISVIFKPQVTAAAQLFYVKEAEQKTAKSARQESVQACN